MSEPFLAERNYVMLYSANGAAMVSVVCLSYVTFMYPAQTVELFGNIFSPYRSQIIPALPASNIFTKFRQSHALRGH